MTDNTNEPRSTNYRLTADQISAYASVGEIPKDGMCYVDWLLWYMLRDIYRNYNTGKINKEHGSELKAKAVTVWEKEWFRIDQINQTANRAAELWRRVESAASAFRIDRTLDNADGLLAAIYGGTMRTDEQKGG